MICSYEELRLPLFEKKKSYFDRTLKEWGICCYIIEVCITGTPCFHSDMQCFMVIDPLR